MLVTRLSVVISINDVVARLLFSILFGCVEHVDPVSPPLQIF